MIFNIRDLPVLDANGQPVASGEPSTPTVEPSAVVSSTVSPTGASTGASTGVATEQATLAEESTATPAATTAAPTATRRPTPVADGRPTARIAMTGSRLNIRGGPGTEYPVIGKALPDEIFIAISRNGPATWVKIAVPEAPDGYGWVSADFVELDSPVVNLPIAQEAANLPTATPQATANAGATPSAESQQQTTTSAQASNQPVAQRTAPTGLSGKLVFQSSPGGTFYLYDLASGAVRPVTGGVDPALSPDGSQIAFMRGDALHLINTDGTNERMIFDGRPGLRSPKWSPDGKWIVFSRADGDYKCRDLGFGGICMSDRELGSQVPKISLPPDRVPPGCDAACQAKLEDQIRKDIKNQVVNQYDRRGRTTAPNHPRGAMVHFHPVPGAVDKRPPIPLMARPSVSSTSLSMMTRIGSQTVGGLSSRPNRDRTGKSLRSTRMAAVWSR